MIRDYFALLGCVSLLGGALWFATRLVRRGSSTDDAGDPTPPPRHGQAWERATTREYDFGRATLAPRDREDV